MMGRGLAGDIGVRLPRAPQQRKGAGRTPVADVQLRAPAEAAGAKLHICHVSTAGAVALLKRARETNADITGEAAPHHFVLSRDSFDGKDTNYKMNPPLRAPADVHAVLSGLTDGTINVIASDHAPHGEVEKNVAYERAANGVIGLETTVPVCIKYLVDAGVLTPFQLIEKLTINPAGILGINKGTLSAGAVADITIIDPNERYAIDKFTFYSKGRNTPFHGLAVRGRAVRTIVGGMTVYSYEGGAYGDRQVGRPYFSA